MQTPGAIRAILFDKDGTLLDFNATWLPRYRNAAQWLSGLSSGQLATDEILALGGYIAEHNCWQPDSLLAAGSNLQILAHWEQLLGRKLEPAEVVEVSGYFGLGAGKYVPVVEPIRPCLSGLHERGYILGIATMDDEQQAHTTAAGLGITDLFSFICGADSGYGVKPEPGMVLAFADQVGVKPEEVVMVGDSPRDIHMGRNAGAGLSVGVLTGAHDATELRRHTDHVLDDITALQAYLEHDMAA